MTGLKTKKGLLLVSLGTLFSLHCFSQVDSGVEAKVLPDHTLMPVAPPPEEIVYKGSLEAGGGIPVPITNKALRASLGGVYNLHFSGNYVVAQHIFAGLELEDTQLGNTAANASFNTLMYIYGIGVKGGYYTYMQKDVLFCYSVSMGPALIKYYYTPDSPPKGGFVQKTFFITPNILAALRVNDELRIGLEISYVVMAYHFDPAYTGINQYVVYNPAKDINALTSCAEFGFGVYWAFDEPKH